MSHGNTGRESCSYLSGQLREDKKPFRKGGWSQDVSHTLYKERGSHPLAQGFSASALCTFGDRYFLSVGAAMCM